MVASARGLTGARYGVIVTVDDAGAPQDFVFSGVTPEEQQELVVWPGSGRLIQHLHELPGPLRLADLPAYARSLGIAPARSFSRTFQGTPMRHRGADVGNFFLAEKADGKAFTDDDEAVLVVFASQARGSDRQRPHAPRGTAGAGRPQSPGRDHAGRGRGLRREQRPAGIAQPRGEADRREPANARLPPEQLLKLITLRRADGREVSLSELPLAQALATGETVRAEEVVLSVPAQRPDPDQRHADPGRRRRHPLDGGDLAGTRTARRDRTAADRVPGPEPRAARAADCHQGLGDDAAGGSGRAEPAEMREFHRIIVEQARHMRGLIGDLLDTGRIESGTLSVVPEPSQVPPVMTDRRRIAQVLNNLFANAARHAPESSLIRVAAAREEARVCDLGL